MPTDPRDRDVPFAELHGNAATDVPLVSIKGHVVPVGRMRALAVRVSQGLAEVLADSSSRARLLVDIESSPFKEHKVRLRDYLLASGRFATRSSELSANLAARVGGPERLVAMLDSLQEMAIYLPVRGHRARWSRGEQPIVATLVRDGESAVAFRIGGDPYSLPLDGSSSQPPILAIVPAELDFESSGALRAPSIATNTCIADCGGDEGSGGGPAPPPQPTQPGVWVTRATLNQSFEGLLNGDPEFEVVLAYRLPGASTLTERQCAGEHAASSSDQPGIQSQSFVFDWNEHGQWEGLVQIATNQQFEQAQATDNGAMILVIEDDQTSCRIKRDSPTFLQWIQGATAGAAFAQSANQADPSTVDLVLKGVALLVQVITLSGNLNQDDFPGMAVERSKVVACTVPQGQSHAIIGANGACHGFLNIVWIR